jgi:hypothetical protein
MYRLSKALGGSSMAKAWPQGVHMYARQLLHSFKREHLAAWAGSCPPSQLFNAFFLRVLAVPPNRCVCIVVCVCVRVCVCVGVSLVEVFAGAVRRLEVCALPAGNSAREHTHDARMHTPPHTANAGSGRRA